MRTVILALIALQAPALASAPIVGGAPNPSDRAAVALVGSRGVYCSGVLIDATHVLTAAHCLPPNIEDPIEALDVFFGDDFSQGGATVAVARALAHPSWTADSFTDDIGILELAQPAPVAPVGLATEPPLAGATLRAVGYGLEQSSSKPGIRRVGSVVANSIDDRTIDLAAGGAVTCEGDSGGPLFDGDLVVGLHSRSNCQTQALAERVDVHAAFIDDFIAGRAPNPETGGDLAGGCQSTGHTGPVAIGLAALACRRRRVRGVR